MSPGLSCAFGSPWEFRFSAPSFLPTFFERNPFETAISYFASNSRHDEKRPRQGTLIPWRPPFRGRFPPNPCRRDLSCF